MTRTHAEDKVPYPNRESKEGYKRAISACKIIFLCRYQTEQLFHNLRVSDLNSLLFHAFAQNSTSVLGLHSAPRLLSHLKAARYLHMLLYTFPLCTNWFLELRRRHGCFGLIFAYIQYVRVSWSYIRLLSTTPQLP